MASNRARSFSLLSCLILVGSIGAQGVSLFLNSKSAEKVSLDLYYESLCPSCGNFIVNDLSAIFVNGLIDIVDLKLFPWGNTKIRPNNTIYCQHGPSECFLDTIEACAINAWPALKEHFPFINCVEKLAYENNYTQWETCFGQLGLDPKPVTDCYSSGYGKELELKYAAETDSLQPPHKYVPWVVVDGQPLYEDYENFTSYVCKVYKGSLPSVCSDLSFDNVKKTKTDDIFPVCYTEETAKMPFLMRIPSSIRSWVLRVIDRAVM